MHIFKSSIKCRRIKEFENPLVESLWLPVRPRRLPRSISVILLAVVYHTTSAGAAENFELYNHIQSNVDSFLCRHPDAAVIVTGDFNPTSTGFSESHLKRVSGLKQIVNFPTRQSSTLDWCLVSVRDLAYTCSQLPEIGSSDHNAILVKPYVHRSQKPNNDRKMKRDLRNSRIRSFGQWITNFDWSDVFQISDWALKFDKFVDIMLPMVDCYFPSKLTKNCYSDKPGITPSLKFAIRKRQIAFRTYKFWRDKVQHNVEAARTKYYSDSVAKLKDTNPSRWWKEIKLLGGLSSRDSWYQQLLSDEMPSCVELAESYNNFLVSLTSHFQLLDDCQVNEAMEVPDRFLVDTGKVFSALRQIKTSKSPGPENFPNKRLRICAFELAPVIVDIYNATVLQGKFPQQLKRAFVVPIPKASPPRSIEEDLRPISLTSQIGKVMEGFTLDSL